jgi:hypothetical protein
MSRAFSVEVLVTEAFTVPASALTQPLVASKPARARVAARRERKGKGNLIVVSISERI